MGIPGPWSPEAMEIFMVLAFYFLLKGRMKFKPASASCYQQHGLLRALPPPVPSKPLIPLLPVMGCSPTHWFPQRGFDHGVKGGLTNCKSDCFHLVQTHRALTKSRTPAQQAVTPKTCGPGCYLWCDHLKKRHQISMGRQRYASGLRCEKFFLRSLLRSDEFGSLNETLTEMGKKSPTGSNL